MKEINDVKNTLKERRVELGYTMKELANLVGVSEATVSRWESGDIANMRRDRIAKLAQALKISPAVIMGWDNSSSSSPDQTAALNPAEEHLLSVFRDLNNDGKNKLLGYADDLQASGRYEKKYDSVSGSVV